MMIVLLNRIFSLICIIFLLTAATIGDVQVCDFEREKADIILAIDMHYRAISKSETERERFTLLLRPAMHKLQYVDDANEIRAPNEPINLIETKFAVYLYFTKTTSHTTSFDSAKYIRRDFMENGTQRNRWITRVNFSSDAKSLEEFITQSLFQARMVFAHRRNSVKIVYLFTEYSTRFRYENDMDSHLIQAVLQNITVVIVAKYRNYVYGWENHISEIKELENKVFFEDSYIRRRVDRRLYFKKYFQTCKNSRCECDFDTTDCYWSNDYNPKMETCVQLRYLTDDRRRDCRMCPKNHTVFCSPQNCARICENIPWSQWSCMQHRSGSVYAERTRNIFLPMEVNRHCMDLERKPCSSPDITDKPRTTLSAEEIEHERRFVIYYAVATCIAIAIVVLVSINLTMWLLWRRDAVAVIPIVTDIPIVDEGIAGITQLRKQDSSLSASMNTSPTEKKSNELTTINTRSASTFRAGSNRSKIVAKSDGNESEQNGKEVKRGMLSLPALLENEIRSAVKEAKTGVKEAKGGVKEARKVVKEVKEAKKVVKVSKNVAKKDNTAKEAKSVATEAKSVAKEAKSVVKEAKSVANVTKSVAKEAKSVGKEAKSAANEAKSVAKEVENGGKQATSDILSLPKLIK